LAGAAALGRGAEVLGRHAEVGEAAAQARLDRFLAERIDGHAEARDFPPLEGTSGLSEHLVYGEIGPRQIRRAAWRAAETGARGRRPSSGSSAGANLPIT
jgi:deoxyribodipyrimidine photo-lyase